MPSKDSQSLTPAYQNLYPRHASLDEAVSHIQAQLPEIDPSRLYGLLMAYHNTLIVEIRKWDFGIAPYDAPRRSVHDKPEDRL